MSRASDVAGVRHRMVRVSGVMGIGCRERRTQRESGAARIPVVRNAGTSVTSEAGVTYPSLMSPGILHFIRASDVPGIGCRGRWTQRESGAARIPDVRNAGTSVTSEAGVTFPSLVSLNVLHFLRGPDAGCRGPEVASGRRRVPGLRAPVARTADRANPEPGKTPLRSSRWRAATAPRNALHRRVHERMLTPAPSSVGRHGDFGVSHPLRLLRSLYLHRRE